MKEKLPQNIQNLLMEIGEKSVLFKLFLLTKENPDWEVYYNLNDTGYDLILLKKQTSKRVRIEVKTRQRLYTTSNEKKKRIVHYTITKNEYENSDFIIAYWFEKNYYFIVPISGLSETSSNGVPVYKFIVREKVDGDIDENSKQYLDKWGLLLKEMNK
ncbi:hypothetical protein [Clostridium drakei]|uniref:PD(D/E)XK endonuclease domain-containing protein n=1 Tax=Clostridium drakei TaxID=332101 RepID=A0A2U8DVG8_9CLOT|nr:hypothetical protein [Clostridium drakei]AWI06763.1 hypothetical protein B9W14_20430 [Clostridium drakei]